MTRNDQIDLKNRTINEKNEKTHIKSTSRVDLFYLVQTKQPFLLRLFHEADFISIQQKMSQLVAETNTGATGACTPRDSWVGKGIEDRWNLKKLKRNIVRRIRKNG